MKFGTKTNSNKKNSMKMFIFSAFEWKYPVLGNLFHKKSKLFVEGEI